MAERKLMKIIKDQEETKRKPRKADVHTDLVLCSVGATLRLSRDLDEPHRPPVRRVERCNGVELAPDCMQPVVTKPLYCYV